LALCNLERGGSSEGGDFDQRVVKLLENWRRRRRRRRRKGAG
jgi:hypothetical protein